MIIYQTCEWVYDKIILKKQEGSLINNNNRSLLSNNVDNRCIRD
jgi:hypothetical protein